MQVERMRDFLKARGIDAAALQGAIIFMRDAPQVKLTAREPDMPALHASQLHAHLQRGYLTETRLSAATAQRIVDALYH